MDVRDAISEGAGVARSDRGGTEVQSVEASLARSVVRRSAGLTLGGSRLRDESRRRRERR